MDGVDEQQHADDRQEDHQRWLGEREETASRLWGRYGGLAPGGIEHLGVMMTQPGHP
jgi:hypothetical protein